MAKKTKKTDFTEHRKLVREVREDFGPVRERLRAERLAAEQKKS